MKTELLNYSILEKKWVKPSFDFGQITEPVIGKNKIYCHYNGLLQSIDVGGNEEKIDFCTDFKEHNNSLILLKNNHICIGEKTLPSDIFFSCDDDSIFVSEQFLNKHMIIKLNKNTLDPQNKSKLFSKIIRAYFNDFIYILYENGLSVLNKEFEEVFFNEDPSIINFYINESKMVVVHFLEENKYKITLYDNFLPIDTIEFNKNIKNIILGNKNLVILSNNLTIFNIDEKKEFKKNEDHDYGTIFSYEDEEYVILAKDNELYFKHLSTGILVKKEKMNHPISCRPIIGNKKILICDNKEMTLYGEKQNVFE